MNNIDIEKAFAEASFENYPTVLRVEGTGNGYICYHMSDGSSQYVRRTDAIQRIGAEIRALCVNAKLHSTPGHKKALELSQWTFSALLESARKDGIDFMQFPSVKRFKRLLKALENPSKTTQQDMKDKAATITKKN